MHKLEEAVKGTPNTKREVKAETLGLGITIKHLTNAALKARRIRITTDRGIQTSLGVTGCRETADRKSVSLGIQMEEDIAVRDPTASTADVQVQTPYWWSMEREHVKYPVTNDTINRPSSLEGLMESQQKKKKEKRAKSKE